MAKLSELLNAGAAGDPRPAQGVAQPSSWAQMQDLMRQLSQPKLTAEFTPDGVTTRQVRTDQDERLLGEIESMRDRLGERRGLARESFGRARGV